MATFVLVHGSHHGGWCWKRVALLHRTARHEVMTPTLTGLGERVHLASREVGLSTHIQDILNVLHFEDLTGVVLVGHSSGGRVITGVAERAPERLAHLVYLDADILVDGECGPDLCGPSAQAAMRERVRTRGEGWYQSVWEDEVSQWGITDESAWAWVRSRVVSQPFRTLTECIHLTGAGASLPGTYINCTVGKELDSPGAAAFSVSVGRATERVYRYRELATGHDAMITAPDELAELLVEMAEGLGNVGGAA